MLLHKVFENWDKKTPRELGDEIRGSFFYWDDFYYVIDEIKKSPDGRKLHILTWCLSFFDNNKYDRVIQYIRDETENDYFRTYLLDAISQWDTVNLERRRNDLRMLAVQVESRFVAKIVSDALVDLEIL